jgi:hypothetical protein
MLAFFEWFTYGAIWFDFAMLTSITNITALFEFAV